MVVIGDVAEVEVTTATPDAGDCFLDDVVEATPDATVVSCPMGFDISRLDADDKEPEDFL